MKDFENKVAFITGAAHGQGRATALALAKEGADIVAFDVAKNVKGKPTCIIAKTIKGKGVSFMENNALWHNNRLTEEQFARAIEEQEVNYD